MTPNQIPVPEQLRDIPKPPQRLFHVGAPLESLLALPRVAIVGSRNISPYGTRVTTELASQLAARGIVIVSGLALGVDGTAHRAALEAGGLTLAVLPSPIDHVVPASHQRLAQRIVESGGALISEYSPGQPPHKQNFIARNRLMSGLADVVVITEAAAKSGSLYTARYALEQGRDVLAVPGPVYSRGSVGANTLIKTGARLVTSYLDVIDALGLQDTTIISQVRGRNTHEQTILDLIQSGETDGAELQRTSKLSISEFNQVLTMLEISGKIRPLGSNNWRIATP